MAASARRPSNWLVRVALLAYPRRFRATMGADLAALCEDFKSAGRGQTVAALIRAGLGVRWDTMTMRAGGGTAIPGGEPPRGTRALFGDFVFGLRILRKSPAFTAVAVGSLAIGIGANTAVFTILDATILRVLPVQEPHELAVLHMSAPEYSDYPDISQSGWMVENDAGHAEASSFSYAFYERIRDAQTPFSDVTAFAELYRLNVRVGDETRLTRGQVVAGNYHSLLGVLPHRGRLLVPDDDRATAPPVVVISHSYWQSRFGGQDEAVGEVVSLNGTRFTIVGVTPPGFEGALQLGSTPSVTVPLAHQAPVMRGRELLPRVDYWWLHILGRVGSNATPEQAREAAALLFAQSLEADLEVTDSVLALSVVPGARGMTEARSEIIEPLRTVVGVVAAVLLIACVNLANLLIARSSARNREIAVRLSLGATRGRIARQLLSESLLLSLMGAGLGMLLAAGLRDLLVPLLDLEGSLTLALDGRALGFTAAVAVATSLLFGVVPALRATRVDLTPALKDEPLRRAGSRFGLGRGLLVVQVALSLGLLVVAGLFAASLSRLLDEATGFDGQDVLTIRVDPRISGYRDAALTQYYEEALSRLRAIPGVAEVGLGMHVPVSGSMSSTSMRIDGYEAEEGERLAAFYNIVDPEFFEVFDIGLRQGRYFGDVDGPGTTPVAIVNQELVDRYLPSVSPLGRRVRLGADESLELEIVGVVDNVKYQNLSDRPWAAVHMLYSQLPSLSAMTWAVKGSTGTAGLAPLAQAELRDLDPDVSLERLSTHQELQRRNVAVPRTFVQLAGGLSAVALLLSCIGLYGVLSYSVAHRTREIGVRMALGARARDVISLIMREMRTVMAGVALGLLGTYYAVRALESQLYNVAPTDVPTMLGAVAVLILVAAVAAFVPARQAAGLDPVEALRTD